MRKLPLWVVLIGVVAVSTARAAEPNILWITAEDMSPNLGCYGDDFATTPHIDAFARDSVRYTNAFATAPACSPSRSCLITGVYATSLGTQRLRSLFPIPAAFRGFPEYLREAGYFTSNNVKTDYNLRGEGALIRAAWDRNGRDAHWRQRRDGQPFFSVFNLMTTHQSRTSVWPHAQFEAQIGRQLDAASRHDPEVVPLPPYYPDAPSVRQTLARYYDCVTAMDAQVGTILRDLAADGLADDTIVFFYSDHGMGMPRGKRLLHDSGMHVPLIIRFPEKYRGFAPAPPGATTDRLVSFVDFAPTVLSLTSLAIPPQMLGRAFLGGRARPPREYVFGARDRVDEVFELSRSVRDRRYLYIRNYMPHLSWMPPERYSDNSVMRRDLQRLRDEGKLNETQLTYAGPRKPVEELYDTRTDPHQVHNLAGSKKHGAVLERLRHEHRRWVLATRDAGFVTEPDAWKRVGKTTPREMALDATLYPLARLREVAALVGRPEAVARQTELLGDSDPAVRYWAAVGLHAVVSAPSGIADEAMQPVRETLHKALEDGDVAVRVEAASALAALGSLGPALGTLTKTLEGDSVEGVMHAMRALELLGEKARPATAAIRHAIDRARKAEKKRLHPCWMFIRFSGEAALEKLAAR